MVERRKKDILTKNSLEIVQLSPDEWEKLRDLKLQSLDEEPVAFEDPEKAIIKYNQRPEEVWRKILSGEMSSGKEGKTVMYFAKDGKDLVGMVSAIIPKPETGQLPVATIQHMYVAENGRGRGMGRKLLTTLLHNLQAKGVEKAELNVVVTQDAAIGLYESLGFYIVGTEKEAINWVNPPLDEYEMELFLQ